MSDLDAVLTRLWEESSSLVRERVQTLENAALAALEGSLATDERRVAEREAHKLAGSLGTFGFHDGTRVSREIEWLLQGDQPLEDDAVLGLAELVVELQRSIEGPLDLTAPVPPEPSAATPEPVASPSEPGTRRPEEPLVLFVDGDSELTQRLIEGTFSAPFQGAAVGDVNAARQAVARRRPSLVVLDPASAGDVDLAFLAEMSSGDDPVPTLVVADPGAALDRVAVARAGGRGFFEKPMSPTSMLEMVGRTLTRELVESAVLVVDDDPGVIDLLDELLPPRGVRIYGLDDPREFWDALEHVRPELIVLDLDMPHVDGLQLCRTVRNDLAWSRLPIMFLSGTSEPGQIQAMFAAGADDHIAKPIVPEILVTRIVSRIERSRAINELSERDARTGLANVQGFTREARRLLDLAARDGRPFNLAVLRPDLPDGPGDPGLADAVDVALSRLLRRSFAPGDVLGALGQSRLGVALYGRSTADVVDRLGIVLEAARAEEIPYGSSVRTVTVSAGLARRPESVIDFSRLLDQAEDGARQARAAGGDRVQAVGGEGSGHRPSVDVLLVEDDEALGPLLVHSLQTRGYQTKWVKDGGDALALLLDDGMEARAVLLDVDLPGLDGLSVLRELAHRGALQRTRVIMLTLRATEIEVLSALDLGAFDHVAKPFSVPVLLHKVRQALESLPNA